MNKEYKYMVATLCKTFNHSSFIESALNGFAMQKTTFPCVYIVIDDASTDGEPEVLRRWAESNLALEVDNGGTCEQKPFGEKYVAYLKNNPQLLFVIILLSENHHGKKSKNPYFAEWVDNAKYQALCEGDDYWINPQKLQKQVEFMESHPDYVLCHTDFVLSDGGWRNHNVQVSDNDVFFPKCIYEELQIGTLTVLFSIEAYRRLPKLWIGRGWPMGDTPTWIEMAKAGKIKYLPDETASYRVLDNSASHGGLEKEISFAEKAVEIRKFYADYYGVPLPNDGYSEGFFVTVEKKSFKYRNKNVARKYKCLAKKLGLTSRKMWLFYYATVCPLFGSLLRVLYKPA